MGHELELSPRVRRRRGNRKAGPSSLDLRQRHALPVYITRGGMVELALTELGARLLWVQPEPTSDSQN
jgi:hypothetical protein